MKKHEWRKQEKTYYLPKPRPEVAVIPSFKFATISGEGNPNSLMFAECIGALYAISYAIKMNLKKVPQKPAGYHDYTVYPLEGIWDLNEEAKKKYDGSFDKDDLVFKIMIRQPEFVTQAFFDEMLELSKKKKANALLDKLQLESIEDGKCIQMLHLGSFDDEPASFSIMEDYASDQDLTRSSKKHREIYLSDFRKVPEEKLRTVLRFKIE